MQDREIEAAIIEQGKQIAELNANMRAAFKRIDEQKSLSVAVQQLAFSVRDLVKTQEATDKSIKQLQDDVGDIKSRPQKRWDAVIGAVIAAVVAFLAGKFLH